MGKFQGGKCFAGSFTRELHGPLTWARAVSKSDEAKALKDEIRPLLKCTSTTLVALSDLLLESLEEAWNDQTTLFYANTAKCGVCETKEPEPEQFKAALEVVLKAIDEAYAVYVGGCTPTPDGSFLSDIYTKNEDAPKRMSEILGFPVSGEESFYALAMRVAQNTRAV